MATLIVVRHGEAEGNSHHRFIGQSQVTLTETGRRQAVAVADRLAGEEVGRVVTSDLTRAVATVTPLARRLGLEIEPDRRLREIDNGDWTGLLPTEISQRWPDMWAEYVNGVDVERPAGERWKDVAARVLEAVGELLADEGTVVVGTHGGPALIVALWAAGIGVEGNIFRGPLGAVHNAAVTIVDTGPRLVAFNDVGHLAVTPDQRLPFEP